MSRLLAQSGGLVLRCRHGPRLLALLDHDDPHAHARTAMLTQRAPTR
jgi:hypothetical protein